MQINVCRIHQIYESFWEHKLTALIIVVSSSDSEKFPFLETRNSGGLKVTPIGVQGGQKKLGYCLTGIRLRCIEHPYL